jgi:c-di-GMP-related signal transduction protein
MEVIVRFEPISGATPRARDTLKLLFSNIDISLTVSLIEAKYANTGRGRSRFPVRSMLLALMFMRFEAIRLYVSFVGGLGTAS